MALPMNKNWTKLVNIALPTIDPGKSCAQYQSEGMDGVPESPVWCVIDDIAEASDQPLEQAAHIFVQKWLGPVGLARIRQALQRGDSNSPALAMCRAAALAVLRESNDDEFATDMATVDRQVERLLATSQERWAMDLLANFPDLGLDISGNQLFREGELTPRVAAFNQLHGRIEEYNWFHGGDFAGSLYAVMRNALGNDGFAQAQRSHDTGQWDDKIRYLCRVVATIFLPEQDPEAAGFTLDQVDRTVRTFLISEAELLDMKQAKCKTLD